MKTRSPQQLMPAAPPPMLHTIEMPPLSIRADVVPATLNDESRTVQLIFSTGADVERFDWMSGKRYIERLSLEPEHIRLDRLNAGAPLLDAHSAWSVADQLGAVVPDSVKLTKTEARATVRFSRRESVEPIWQDVRDGLIRSVSVGYRTYRYEETEPKGNKMPIRVATDWEPFEISMVPIPADAGAKTRGDRRVDTNSCQVSRAQHGGSAKEKPMATEIERSETMVEANPLATEKPRTEEAPTEPSERDQGMEAERKRVQHIRNACIAARMTRSFEDKLIADGLPLVDAQNAIFDELRKRGGDSRGPANGPSGVRVEFVGEDPFLHVRAGIENALLHRIRPKTSSDEKGFELDDRGRQYRGMTMLRIAEAYLNNAGVRTTSLSKVQIAGLALGLQTRDGGMHTTSDFANLLADVANKSLRRAYEEAPQTWRPIARQTFLPDFKPAKRLQLGEAPALSLVNEHGEFTFGTITEGKEQYQLATFGKRFAITRKSLVNDDTDAFSRIPMLFGRSARALESDSVYYQILKNANMGDNVALFDTGHGNLTGSGTAISVDSLGVGYAAVQVQKGLDGATFLNLSPRFLLVPPGKITLALQYTTVITPAQGSNVNPFAGLLSPISEPRLSGGVTYAGDTAAGSATAWYLAASPDQIDIIEYAYLEGESGPTIESRVGWEVDGLEIKCREDFASKVIDWRGLYKNAGA